MNLTKHIPDVITSKVGRQLLQAQKYSPQILFVAGVVGVVATVVMASKATLKLEETLDEATRNLEAAQEVRDQADIDSENVSYTEEDFNKDRALIYLKNVGSVAKLYAPAIFVGVASVGALTGAHIILTNRTVALTAAYAALEKGYNEYRKRVLADVGEEKEQTYRYDNEKVSVPRGDGKKPILVNVPTSQAHSVYARFFDEHSQSWGRQPEYNLVFVKCQQNYANDMLRSRGHVFLNEVYDMLGIERSKAGAVVGWIMGKEGDNFIDFGLYDGNERARAFVNGIEGSILLDFNVDGVIYDKI